MNKPLQALRAFQPLLACLLVMALASSQALAQDGSGDERWYQVELIVFAQGGSPDDGEELWPNDIALSYPARWLELVDLSQSDLANEDDGGWQDEAAPAHSSNEPGERALALLPAEELTLRSDVQRLNRNNQYRVLFHGGWRQAFAENRQEPSILITGGEAFGDHYELEGSIHLSLRTYLHIDTNLWLTQFNTNFGQERETWPALPRRPNQAVDTDLLFRLNSSPTQWQALDPSWDYQAILAQPHVVENIMLLKQSRRMRSGELHYLDHPKMGLLIKLIPYEPEEIQ